MNFKLKYIIIVAALFLFSCETTVDNPNLDYEKKLVIQGFITANTPIHIADISKTVPPLEFPEIENVKLGDSIAHVILNGEKYYYTKNCGTSQQCIEYQLDSIDAKPGDSLYFEGNAEGSIATAIVHIPEELPLEPKFFIKRSRNNFAFDDRDSVATIYIEFNTSNDYAYRVFRDTFISYSELVVGSNISNNRLRLQIDNLFYSESEEVENYLENFKQNLIQIHTYELAMATYEETKFYGGGFDGIFSGNGLNQQGNIDNGVGILAGRLINFVEINEIEEIK